MKTYEELLAERDALVAQVEAIRRALNNQLNDCINFDGGKLTDCVMLASSVALKALPQQCLAEVKAEAGRAGFIEGYEQCHYDIDNDYISRSEPMADEYAAKIRSTGTWLKDSNVNGGKRQGGE